MDDNSFSYEDVAGAPPTDNSFSYEDVAAPAAASTQPQQDPGFLSRVGTDLEKRNQMVQGAVDQFGVGPSALAAGVGKGVFGSANDIVGEGVKSGYDTLVPDSVKKTISKGVGSAEDYLANTDVGKYVAGKAKDASSAYSDFAAQNPKTANALESGADVASGMANLIPLAKGAEAVAPAITKAGSAALDSVSKPAQTLKAGWKAMTPEALQAASEAQYQSAGIPYSQMRAAGAVYNPDSINDLQNSVNVALKNKDIIPKLRPVTTDVVQQINDAAENGDLSLNHLDQFRRQLKYATGEDSAAASAVRKAIDTHIKGTTEDDLVSGSPDAVAWLNRGRAAFTRAANFDDVSTLLQKANGDPTKIKNSINMFLASPENTAGMTGQEISLLRRASQTSTAESMSKMLGKAGFTIIPTNAQGNGVLPYVMAGSKAGALSLVPGGKPLVAAGTAARAGNTLYGRGLAQQALDAIGSRTLPPEPTPTYITGQLGSPSVKVPPGGFGTSTPAPAEAQKLLPRGNEDTYYQPTGRSLTYQPRADYEVTPDGFASKPSDIAPPAKRPAEGAIFRRAGAHMADRNVLSDLTNFPPKNARGGRIKTHTGKVVKKQLVYPAIEAMRQRP